MTRNKRRNRKQEKRYQASLREHRREARRVLVEVGYQQLSAKPIRDLRKMSRGKVSGGYRMTKPQLVAALLRVDGTL
jgi:hypothetical protein